MTGESPCLFKHAIRLGKCQAPFPLKKAWAHSFHSKLLELLTAISFNTYTPLACFYLLVPLPEVRSTWLKMAHCFSASVFSEMSFGDDHVPSLTLFMPMLMFCSLLWSLCTELARYITQKHTVSSLHGT